MFTLRMATRDDYEALQPLVAELDMHHVELLPERFQPVDGPPRTRAHFEAIIDDPDQDYVLGFDAEKGAVVGYARVLVQRTPEYPMFIPRAYVVVDGIVVAEAYRGRGLGRALMDRVVAWGHARGLDEIELTVYAANAISLAAYEAMGFAPLRHRLHRITPAS